MSKKRVLFVDDDRDLAQSAKVYLENRGYAVELAHNSSEASASMAEHCPDVIVLDIMMDYDAEGFNFAYKLREDPATKGIPIIICSAFEQHLDTKLNKFEFVLGRDWPAEALIQKPADLHAIAEKIERILAKPPFTAETK